MQLKYQNQNPFNRNHLFHPPPRLASSNINSSNYNKKHDDLLYQSRIDHYPINIWNFRDDHNSKFTPHTPARNFSQITSFEKSMMTSAVTSRRELSNSHLKYSLVEDNPFHRKNLLISREEVQNEIQKDIRNYNYKNWEGANNYKKQKDTSYEYQPSKYDNYNYTPNPPTLVNNESIMMTLKDNSYNRQSQSPKKRQSLQRKPEQQTKKQYESPTKKIQNAQLKQSHNHTNYKQEITVRGQKFFKTKVFPLNSGR